MRRQKTKAGAESRPRDPAEDHKRRSALLKELGRDTAFYAVEANLQARLLWPFTKDQALHYLPAGSRRSPK